MVLVLFDNLTEKDKTRAIDNLISESTPRQDFFLLVILSVLMATFGLLLNSAAVIIGSMLIAPILYPILSLSLGIVIADLRLISRSFYTLVKSIAFAIASAALTTLFFKPTFFDLHNEEARFLFGEILSRTEPTIIYGAIAIIAGLAASFALIKPHLSESLPGTAISVALIPPLAVTGIGVATLDWNLISNSFMLFIVNTIGIIFASLIVFSLMHLYIKREEVQKAIKRESNVMEKEIEKAKRHQGQVE